MLLIKICLVVITVCQLYMAFRQFLLTVIIHDVLKELESLIPKIRSLLSLINLPESHKKEEVH